MDRFRSYEYELGSLRCSYRRARYEKRGFLTARVTAEAAPALSARRASPTATKRRARFSRGAGRRAPFSACAWTGSRRASSSFSHANRDDSTRRRSRSRARRAPSGRARATRAGPLPTRGSRTYARARPPLGRAASPPRGSSGPSDLPSRRRPSPRLRVLENGVRGDATLARVRTERMIRIPPVSGTLRGIKKAPPGRIREGARRRFGPRAGRKKAFRRASIRNEGSRQNVARLRALLRFSSKELFSP